MPGDLEDPRITAFGMLLESHAALVGTIGRDLEEVSGLPLNSFGILLRLARTPGQRLRMTELAAQASLSTSGLTRLVDRLEEAGHLRRDPSVSDRRSSFATLTDQGAQVVTDALPSHLESLERTMAGPLGADGIASLTSMLAAIRDCARATPVRPLDV
ncbi:MAG TPA: MarR family transcriptional regulator [Acidimicrobiales bacterium]|nr:MarR family transcriptional regulator [Acidimicrobiales bacterium]